MITVGRLLERHDHRLRGRRRRERPRRGAPAWRGVTCGADVTVAGYAAPVATRTPTRPRTGARAACGAADPARPGPEPPTVPRAPPRGPASAGPRRNADPRDAGPPDASHRPAA